MSSDNKHRRLDDDLQSKAELLHELQVQQIELEMQNRQLSEAQQQLEESRDRYADLYDYAPVGYLTLDEKGTVLEINLTGASMLGTERINIVDKLFVQFLMPDSIQSFTKHLEQCFFITENNITEISLKVKQGKPRLLALESRAMAGRVNACRTVMTDITEKRRLAIELQVNNSAQQVLLNTIPALVFYLDNDLQFMNVSQAFADFLGRSPEEIRGKTISDLISREVAEDVEQECRSVLQSGVARYGFEYSVPDESGTSVSLSTMLAPYRDSQGKYIGLAGVSIDISSIKTAAISNSELLIQNRKLTRNLFAAIEAERSHMARELHDELGQWFTAIQAEAQVICNVAKHDPRIHESALSISKSASAVHEVIRGMLRHLRPSLLDELGLADSLRELQRQWCHSHPDIECEFNLDESLDSLGEERNIIVYRLVQESLNNIASHAHAHRVSVSMALKNAGSDDSVLLLRIEDDGVGFSNENIRAGMGLLGMRERVIAANGKFSIESSPKKGTRIYAWLPMNQAEHN